LWKLPKENFNKVSISVTNSGEVGHEKRGDKAGDHLLHTKLKLDEHCEAERNIWFGQATEEQKIAMRKFNLLKYIDNKNMPKEVIGLL